MTGSGLGTFKCLARAFRTLYVGLPDVGQPLVYGDRYILLYVYRFVLLGTSENERLFSNLLR